ASHPDHSLEAACAETGRRLLGGTTHTGRRQISRSAMPRWGHWHGSMMVEQGRAPRRDGCAHGDDHPNPGPLGGAARAPSGALAGTSGRPADARVGRGSGPDAPDRRAPAEPSVCRSPEAARSAPARQAFEGASARVHPDDVQGH
ncbi:MAG: hypothetical protein ABIU05_01090, partial [Nitrospirales bacterium]